MIDLLKLLPVHGFHFSLDKPPLQPAGAATVHPVGLLLIPAAVFLPSSPAGWSSAPSMWNDLLAAPLPTKVNSFLILRVQFKGHFPDPETRSILHLPFQSS